MDHFKSIGFDISQLQEYPQKAYDNNDVVKGNKGKYYKLPTDSSSVLIIALRPEGIFRKWSIVGINPHFEGVTKNTILIESFQEDEEHLEAVCYAWMSPNEPKSNPPGEFPFLFNLAYADRFKKVDLLGIRNVKITCYPHQLFSIADQNVDFESFLEQSFGRPAKLAKQAFICEGLFNGSQKGKPVALITGTIESVEKRKNNISGFEFYTCVLKTFNCKIDVVFSTEQTNHIPEVGNLVAGRFWLSGEVI